MTPIPASVEVAVQAGRTIHILGPHDTNKGEIEVLSDNPGEVTLRFLHDSRKGRAYATMPEEVAMTLVLRLVDRLGLFPALLDRLK
jgi:hypothetical protein